MFEGVCLAVSPPVLTRTCARAYPYPEARAGVQVSKTQKNMQKNADCTGQTPAQPAMVHTLFKWVSPARYCLASYISLISLPESIRLSYTRKLSTVMFVAFRVTLFDNFRLPPITNVVPVSYEDWFPPFSLK